MSQPIDDNDLKPFHDFESVKIMYLSKIKKRKNARQLLNKFINKIKIEMASENTKILMNNFSECEENKSFNIVNILHNQMEFIDYLFHYSQLRKKLTHLFIINAHKKLTKFHDYTLTDDGHPYKIEKGKYRDILINHIRENRQKIIYCLPENINTEMDFLIKTYNSKNTFPSPVKAAWLHQLFAQIHPFVDGNGRVARALVSYSFLQDGFFPIVFKESERANYAFHAIESVHGNIIPMAAAFATDQKNTLLQAIDILDQ